MAAVLREFLASFFLFEERRGARASWEPFLRQQVSADEFEGVLDMIKSMELCFPCIDEPEISPLSEVVDASYDWLCSVASNSFGWGFRSHQDIPLCVSASVSAAGALGEGRRCGCDVLASYR